MRLHLFHTNDIHSHLENWPIIERFINLKKMDCEQYNEATRLIDVGDAIDFFHPMVEATGGQIMVDLFNELGYDLVTIGNNEGLNMTPTELDTIYRRRSFEVVLANLRDKRSGQIPQWCQPWRIDTVGSLTIAYIGLTAPYKTYQLNGYEIEPPIEALQSSLDAIKKNAIQPDVIILLSHLGVKDDRYIAQLFPEINIILGGHTHHHWPNGEWVNDTLLTACGRYGEYVGEVIIQYDETTRSWDYYCDTYSLDHMREIVGLQEAVFVDTYAQMGERLLAESPVPMLPQAVHASQLTGSHSFIQLALRALLWYSRADFALLNSGLFLDDLSPQWTSDYEIHRALPHSMHLAQVTFTGSQLIELLNELQDKQADLVDLEVRGLGFRGRVFGTIVMTEIQWDQGRQQWTYQGEPISADCQYQCMTVDHLTFLPFFGGFRQASQIEILFPDLLRAVVRDYLLKSKEVRVCREQSQI